MGGVNATELQTLYSIILPHVVSDKNATKALERLRVIGLEADCRYKDLIYSIGQAIANSAGAESPGMIVLDGGKHA